MTNARNIPALITLAAFTLPRSVFLLLEATIQTYRAEGFPLPYELDRAGFDRLIGLGLVEITRSGLRPTEKADTNFRLLSSTTHSNHVEPRDAFDTYLFPLLPLWSTQRAVDFMPTEEG
jgi:hypothetical protein